MLQCTCLLVCETAGLHVINYLVYVCGSLQVQGQEVILSPGDVLHVPAYWFLHTEALETQPAGIPSTHSAPTAAAIRQHGVSAGVAGSGSNSSGSVPGNLTVMVRLVAPVGRVARPQSALTLQVCCTSEG